MGEPTIQVEVRRLKRLVSENRKLSRENDRLRKQVEDLEKEVRRLAQLWGEEDTDPGPLRKK